MHKKFLVVISLILLTGCATSPVKVTQPLQEPYRGHLSVHNVSVEYGEAIAEKIAEFDADVVDKRQKKGLLPEVAEKPNSDEYVLLPFHQMLEYVIEDTVSEKLPAGNVPIDIHVQVDTLKLANAGLTILLGDSDELAGLVTIQNADTRETIGEFYVDILKNSGGLLGLAVRGGGVREKLASKFAGYVSEQLGPLQK